MKISLRTRIAGTVLLAATGVLVAVTDYTDKHKILEVDAASPVEMSASLTMVESDIVARVEAQEVATIIDKIDNISLSSYSEIQEARKKLPAILV